MSKQTKVNIILHLTFIDAKWKDIIGHNHPRLKEIEEKVEFTELNQQVLEKKIGQLETFS